MNNAKRRTNFETETGMLGRIRMETAVWVDALECASACVDFV